MGLSTKWPPRWGPLEFVPDDEAPEVAPRHARLPPDNAGCHRKKKGNIPQFSAVFKDNVGRCRMKSWNGERESNPPRSRGRPGTYHYDIHPSPTPAAAADGRTTR